MLASTNWSGVWQSIVDTWLPLIGFIVGVIVIVAIFKMIKKKRNRDEY